MVVVEEAENLQDPAYVYHQQQSAEALSKSITEEDEEEIESQHSSKDHAYGTLRNDGDYSCLAETPLLAGFLYLRNSSRLKCQKSISSSFRAS